MISSTYCSNQFDERNAPAFDDSGKNRTPQAISAIDFITQDSLYYLDRIGQRFVKIVKRMTPVSFLQNIKIVRAEMNHGHWS